MAFDVVKIGGFDIYSEFLHNHVFGKVIEGTYNCKKILSLSFAESWICEIFFSVKFSLLSLSLSLSLTHSLTLEWIQIFKEKFKCENNLLINSDKSSSSIHSQSGIIF